MAKRLTTEEWVKKAKSVHGDLYDYSKSEYINGISKIEIICKKHGSFFQKAKNHTNSKQGCPECKRQNLFLTTEDFIDQSTATHGDLYDYSKVNYVDNKTKVEIICKEHGSFFQRPDGHMTGIGCGKCRTDDKRVSGYQYIKNAKLVHGNLYDYKDTIYKDRRTELTIICKEHGEFKQLPHNHLAGNGCPLCNNSKGENRIAKYLNDNNISFETEKKFEGMEYKDPLRCDFYLPEYNLVIEYNGEQHYEPIEYFGGNKGFELTQLRDDIKKEYLKENNINLLTIHFSWFNRIEEVLKDIL